MILTVAVVETTSGLCSWYTKDQTPFKETPFLETFLLCVKRNIIFPHFSDFGGGLSVQRTLSRSAFPPHRPGLWVPAAPGWGTGSAVEL